MSDWLKWADEDVKTEEDVKEKDKPKIKTPEYVPKPIIKTPISISRKGKRHLTKRECADLILSVDQYLKTFKTAYHRTKHNQLSQTKHTYERMKILKKKIETFEL